MIHWKRLEIFFSNFIINNHLKLAFTSSARCHRHGWCPGLGSSSEVEFSSSCLPCSCCGQPYCGWRMIHSSGASRRAWAEQILNKQRIQLITVFFFCFESLGCTYVGTPMLRWYLWRRPPPQCCGWRTSWSPYPWARSERNWCSARASHARGRVSHVLHYASCKSAKESKALTCFTAQHHMPAHGYRLTHIVTLHKRDKFTVVCWNRSQFARSCWYCCFKTISSVCHCLDGIIHGANALLTILCCCW